MLLFVGLGNPGTKHAGNRHNIGFMTVQAIAEKYKDRPGLEPERWLQTPR